MRNVSLVMVILLSAITGCANSPSHKGSAPAPSVTPTAPSSQPSSPASVSQSPPAISETFTRLPCDSTTTTGMEGCAEQAVLRSDAAINHDLGRLWAQAAGPAARAHLAEAQQAWMTYRTSTCTSEADAFAGGSEAPVTFGECLARVTQQRAAELAEQLALVP